MILVVFHQVTVLALQSPSIMTGEKCLLNLPIFDANPGTLIPQTECNAVLCDQGVFAGEKYYTKDESFS